MTAARARMRALSLIGLIAFACIVPGPARAADESAGTRTASFLSNGSAPATLAMGGASLGLGRDLQGATHNAAALARIGELQFAFAHANLADESAQEWAAVGGQLGRQPWRWALSGTFRDDGSIPGRDSRNQPTADVSAQSVALGLNLARPLGSQLVVGGAARYVGEAIGESRGNGLSFDAGVQLRAGLFGFGVAGKDFGGGMLWGGQRWRMPASLGAGVAFDHPRSGLHLALDVLAPATYYRSVRAGGEWQWHDRFALRGGWRGELGAASEERLSGPTFGAGVHAGRTWVDYAYVVSGDGTAAHRMGLTLGVPGAGASAGTARSAASPRSAGPENAPGR